LIRTLRSIARMNGMLLDGVTLDGFMGIRYHSQLVYLGWKLSLEETARRLNISRWTLFERRKLYGFL